MHLNEGNLPSTFVGSAWGPKEVDNKSSQPLPKLRYEDGSSYRAFEDLAKVINQHYATADSGALA